MRFTIFNRQNDDQKRREKKSGGKQNTEVLRENETLEVTMKSEKENNRNGMSAGRGGWTGSVRDGSTGLLGGSGPLGTPDRGSAGGCGGSASARGHQSEQAGDTVSL